MGRSWVAQLCIRYLRQKKNDSMCFSPTPDCFFERLQRMRLSKSEDEEYVGSSTSPWPPCMHQSKSLRSQNYPLTSRVEQVTEMLESFEWHTKSQPELDSTPSETTTTAKFLHNPAISFTRKTTSHWFSSQKEAERKCLNWHLSFLVCFFKKKRSTVLRSVDPIDTILFFFYANTCGGPRRQA